jgi:hypothetical protein
MSWALKKSKKKSHCIKSAALNCKKYYFFSLQSKITVRLLRIQKLVYVYMYVYRETLFPSSQIYTKNTYSLNVVAFKNT